MKKLLILLLALVLITLSMFSLSACGNGDPAGGSSSPAGGDSSESKGNNEQKAYGICEEAKTDVLSIRIDKAVVPSSDILIYSAKDGYKFLQVYFTFKNISDETIETPKNKAFYIVYEEGATGDDSDMTSDDGSNVLPGDAKESMYRGYVELAPGESVSGWMLYQRLSDQNEVTIHYYSGYINKAPDFVFKFPVA